MGEVQIFESLSPVIASKSSRMQVKMPRKNKASYQEYMREYMRLKRQGLTVI